MRVDQRVERRLLVLRDDLCIFARWFLGPLVVDCRLVEDSHVFV